MTEQKPDLKAPMTDLPKQEWLEAIAAATEDDGSFATLGKRHFAAFIEMGTTLLVTFETFQGIHALSPIAQPFGWEMLHDHGWSHLCLASDGDTWFRDPAVYAYFDRLIDDGFFDEFDNVIFYGAGPCAYAAAAYSVSAPASQVVLIQPQATLDPRITDWDDRFTDMRRTDFTSRYGYAPDMLEAAQSAYVLYDPRETLDAMHAALFTRPNVTKFRMPHMGAALQTDLMEMGILGPMLQMATDNTLDKLAFARLYRARRDYRPYLRTLLSATEEDTRDALTLSLCKYVTTRVHDPRFVRKLRHLEGDS
ncbi:MAG: phosphoadenosine phosphosulfate reductase [Sulfitobacter sp.]